MLYYHHRGEIRQVLSHQHGALPKLTVPVKKGMPNRIREWRERRDLTLAELGSLVSTSAQQIHRLEQGQRQLTEDWMRRLSRALRCEIVDILTTDNVMLVNKPLVTTIIVGWGDLAAFDPQAGLDETADWLEVSYLRKTLVALAVVDDTMNRVAPKAAHIVVDYEDRKLIDGKYYVITENGTDFLFRRFRGNPPRFETHTTGDIQTVFQTETLIIYGRVVQVIHDL